jgi:integrase
MRAVKLGFAKLRFHDLRATHETMLLDAGVPVHVAAATIRRCCSVSTRNGSAKADTSAAAVIGTLSRKMLGTLL